MYQYNKNSGYGHMFGKENAGKVFCLGLSTDLYLASVYSPDPDGTLRFYSTWADVIAVTVAGRGDQILVASSFVTAPTLAQIATMNTNGVTAKQLGNEVAGHYTTNRASATIPATTTTPYFTVTGKVKILNIIGEVTTAFGAVANAVKLVSTPTVGAVVDLCATVEGNAASLGSLLTITGTLANAMVKTVSGAVPSQATPVIVTAGTIGFTTAATTTGATKWTVIWEPVDQGASVFVA